MSEEKPSKKKSVLTHAFNMAIGASVTYLVTNAQKFTEVTQFATENWQNGLITGVGAAAFSVVAGIQIWNSKLCRTTIAATAIGTLAYADITKPQDPYAANENSSIEASNIVAQYKPEEFSKFQLS
jgi:predicted ATP-grasp superfamily ATP-dependent carboligase